MSAVARTLSRALEFVADFCLVVLSLVAFIIAAITVDQPIKFQHDYIELVYFNLQSYYETATHTVSSILCFLLTKVDVNRVICSNFYPYLPTQSLNVHLYSTPSVPRLRILCL